MDSRSNEGAPPAREEESVITARWVLPIASPPLEDGAVHLKGGRIVGVGPAHTTHPASPGTRVDLGDVVLLPGLVNVHTHLELTALRGAFEELDFFTWIRRLADTKDRRLDAADYRASARWGAIEAIRSGITTVGDASSSGTVLDALLESGLRGIAYQEVFGPDERRVPESLAALEALLDTQKPRASSRVRLGVSPHAPYTVSAALFREVSRLALDRSLPVSIHAAESRAESELLREGRGPFADFLRERGITWKAPRVSAVRYLSDTGVLETKPLLVHAVQVDSGDVRELRDAGAAVAHCPKSNAKLAHGIAPLVELLESGVRTGLGTDGVVSNNGCDLLEEARCAVLFQRTRPGVDRRRLEPLDARAALRLATLGGAEALGLDQEIGSIEAGKLADLTAIRLSSPHVEPVHDPEAAVVFSASGRDIVFTMVDGKVLWRDGRLATLDEAALLGEVRQTARKLSGDKGLPAGTGLKAT